MLGILPNQYVSVTGTYVYLYAYSCVCLHVRRSIYFMQTKRRMFFECIILIDTCTYALGVKTFLLHFAFTLETNPE